MFIAWAIISVLLVIGASRLDRADRRIDNARLDRHADRMGLPLPRELRGPLAERGAARERTIRAAGWIGLAIGALLGVGLEVLTDADGLGGAVMFVVASLGVQLGGAVAQWRQRATRSSRRAPRVEREPAPMAEHYSTKAEETGAWAALGALLIVPAVAWMTVEVIPGEHPGARAAAIAALVAAVLGLVAWALLRGAETRTAQRPQYARDDVELAWDDAGRTTAIRRLRGLMAMVAPMPAAALVVMLAELAPVVPELAAVERGAAFWTLFWAGVIALVCALGPAAFMLVGRRDPNPSLRLRRGTDPGSDPR